MRPAWFSTFALVASARAVNLLPTDITSVVAPTETLHISFPQPTGATNVRVEFPGQQLYANQTSLQPILNAECLSPSGSYLIMMLDPDSMKANHTDTKGKPGTTLLHWIWGNLTYDPTLDLLVIVDPDDVYNDPNSALAYYIGPGPAPGITKPVHEYTMMLFDQPDCFTYPMNYTKFWNASSSDARIGFPYAQFIKQSGLGQPIASNWWTENTPACNGTKQDYFGICPGK